MKTMCRRFFAMLAAVMMFTTPIFARADALNNETVTLLLELTFSAIDCDYDIHGNSSGYVVRFSSEDYSYMYIMSQLFGNADTDTVMNEIAESTATLCANIRKDIMDLGFTPPNLTLMITNNTEKDYIFLIVCNGQVVYDILAD